MRALQPKEIKVGMTVMVRAGVTADGERFPCAVRAADKKLIQLDRYVEAKVATIGPAPGLSSGNVYVKVKFESPQSLNGISVNVWSVLLNLVSHCYYDISSNPAPETNRPCNCELTAMMNLGCQCGGT